MSGSTIFTDVRTALKNDPGVMAIAKEVYQGRPSSEAPYPYISIQAVGGRPLVHFDGEDALQNILLQIDCWGLDLDTTHSLHYAAKPVLNGPMNNGTKLTYTEPGLIDDFDGDARCYRSLSRWSAWGH